MSFPHRILSAVERIRTTSRFLCVGALLKLLAEGTAITIVCVPNGDKGAGQKPDMPHAELTKPVFGRSALADKIGARFVNLGAEDEHLFDTREMGTPWPPGSARRKPMSCWRRRRTATNRITTSRPTSPSWRRISRRCPSSTSKDRRWRPHPQCITTTRFLVSISNCPFYRHKRRHGAQERASASAREPDAKHEIAVGLGPRRSDRDRGPISGPAKRRALRASVPLVRATRE